VVQKYLLEKSRIVSQGRNERNYHVFYYLLAGANEQEKQVLHLRNYEWYNYLNKSGCYGLENIDERHEFSRLKQSMEMVGFTPEKQRRLFAVLSAVLLLGIKIFFYIDLNLKQLEMAILIIIIYIKIGSFDKTFTFFNNISEKFFTL
jgi:myosin heavy subunit